MGVQVWHAICLVLYAFITGNLTSNRRGCLNVIEAIETIASKEYLLHFVVLHIKTFSIHLKVTIIITAKTTDRDQGTHKTSLRFNDLCNPVNCVLPI